MLDTLIHTPKGTAFGLQIIDNRVYVHPNTYDVLHRVMTWHAREIIIYILALESLVHHNHTIPNVEFVIAVNDQVLPNTKLPLFRYCTTVESFDIPIPSFHFYSFHKVFKTLIQPPQKYEWYEKEASAYASFTPYERMFDPKLPSTMHRWVNKTIDVSTRMVRGLMEEWSRDYASYNPPITLTTKSTKPMVEWGKHKYIVHIDGISCSNKLEESLATGSLVFKEESGFSSFFHTLIQPFVHYIPWFKTTHDDLLDGLDWAMQNDHYAKRIASNGRAFTQKYLTPPTIRCYWRALFHEYAKLLQFNVTSRTRGVPAQEFLNNIKTNRSDLWNYIYID
jgi:hypothetical protein